MRALTGYEDTGPIRPLTRIEQRTAHFYAWERRGRGWQVWPEPVELEPPFRPFHHHAIQAPRARYDDGRRHTWLSRLTGRFRRYVTGGAPVSVSISPPVPNDVVEPVPSPYLDGTALVEIDVTVPADLTITKTATQHFLSALSPIAHPVSFELIGTEQEVFVRWCAATQDVAQLETQLAAHFPDAVLTEPERPLATLFDDDANAVVVDFGLTHEFMLPLRTMDSFQVDPLIAAVGALSALKTNEVGLFQVLFRPVRHPWGADGQRAITDEYGKPFFIDAPTLLPLATRKLSRPLFAVVLRIAARSVRRERAGEIARQMSGALAQFDDPASNQLMPLSDVDYPADDHLADLRARRTRRSGMLLNSDELISLMHLPSASVRSPRLARIRGTTRLAPAVTRGEGIVLGTNTHAGTETVVHIPGPHRLRHTHVIGATGTGKSHLLLNLIIQDMAAGSGVGVLDPHGDLVDQILAHVPADRTDDVVLLDVSDETHAVGLNLLDAHSPLERTLLASDLVAVFRRLATSWGDQMTAVLRNAILAFLESDRGGTIADLRRFLVEPGYRAQHLSTVTDPEVVYFWEKEFPLLSGRPQAPLLTRLTTFLAPRAIREIVSQREGRLDLTTTMDQGKIFLAKLAQGAVGEENASLLGSLLVAKFQQLTLARQALAASERTPFHLYVDEFQHFVTPSMAQILAGARKYGLGLTLAHQGLQQLSGQSRDVASAVLTNPALRVCFRVGHQDARKLAEGLAHFDAEDLQQLDVGEAICRIERADWDFNLRTLPLPGVDDAVASQRQEEIITRSRERYATPRPTVATPHAAPPPTRPASAPRETVEETRSLAEKADEVGTAPAPTEHASERSVAPLGRGGPDHVYLQNLIARWAKSRGWKTTVEKPVLGGAGRVDVALDRDDWSLACEISVSSSPKQERGNVEKCLEAGFSEVAVISTERGFLERAQSTVGDALDTDERDRVLFLTPEELFAHLEDRAAQLAGGEDTVRGYTVETRFRSIEGDDRDTRSQAISRVIARAVHRLKGKD